MAHGPPHNYFGTHEAPDVVVDLHRRTLDGPGAGPGRLDGDGSIWPLSNAKCPSASEP